MKTNERALGRAPAPALSWVLLGLGVVAASVSAILIRYADDAPALALSFWRCAVGAVVLAPFARFGRSGRAGLSAAALAGAFLAVHFATWISSVNLTTVALSVLLVSTTPVFAAGAAHVLFGERIGRRGWVGIAVALGGTALIAGVDLGGSSLVGNLLALAGGAAAAGYVMAGATARQELGIVEYAVVAYGVAALLLLPVCLIGRVELVGYGSTTWLALAGIVVFPQLLGHTVINLVLKDIDATTVSVTIMAEPVIATVLAFVLFDEVPGLLIYPGGAAILAGIYLVSTVPKPEAVVVE
jgi:drug/metabolite transporter (DMT)-like permease